MKQTKIRTKIDLLKALDNLTKVDNEYLPVNSDKYKKVKEHKDLIQLIATGLPKTADISDLSSLDFGEQSLEEYVKNNSVEIVEKRLISIDSDINTRTSQYANKYDDYCVVDGEKVKDLNVGIIATFNEMREKSHNVRNVMCVGFIVLTVIFLAAAICLLVSAFNDFLGESGEKIASALCTVAGVLDFINGWAFTEYERRDDMKKSKIGSIASRAGNEQNPREYFESESAKVFAEDEKRNFVEKVYSKIYNISLFNCNIGGGNQVVNSQITTDKTKQNDQK